MSDGEINRRRQQIDAHLSTLAERDAALTCQLKGLQQAKEQKNLSEMFTGHQTARQTLSQHVTVPTDCAKDFNVSFQYSSRTDGAVRQHVANLGNIVFQS